MAYKLIKRGEWNYELADNGWMDITCTNCGYKFNEDVHVYIDYQYCPGCGATMELSDWVMKKSKLKKIFEEVDVIPVSWLKNWAATRDALLQTGGCYDSTIKYVISDYKKESKLWEENNA